MGFELHSELFVEEAVELLAAIEAPLMELENDPSKSDLVNEVFRILHTIKGSGSMFGFDEIASFTHNLETTYDRIRNGELEVTPEIIELTLMAKDCIRDMLSGDDSVNAQALRKQILGNLESLTQGESKEEAPQPQKESLPAVDDQDGEKHTYTVVFEPQREILLRGVRVAPLLDELASLGDVIISADYSSVPLLNEFNAEHCYLSWQIKLQTTKPEGAIRSVFIFVEDYAKIKITSGDIKKDESVSSELFVKETEPAIPKQKPDTVKEIPLIERRKIDTTSIRVKNEKLDMLMNQVGELVTLHARLLQESNKERLSEFISISESLGRITADLRDSTMSVRMVPLERFTNE